VLCETTAGHVHTDQIEAAWCRAKRIVVKRGIAVSNKQKKLAKRLAKANKAVELRAAQLLQAPIVPDTSDIAKRSQNLQDFALLYRAGRQQMARLS
jgi:hypothetical protein